MLAIQFLFELQHVDQFGLKSFSFLFTEGFYGMPRTSLKPLLPSFCFKLTQSEFLRSKMSNFGAVPFKNSGYVSGMKTLILDSLNALSRIQTSSQLANIQTKSKLHPPLKCAGSVTG